MSLSAYRDQHGLTLAAMAVAVSEKLGRKVDLTMIHRIERGSVPKRDVARAIIAATDGQVSALDLYGVEAENAA